MPVKSLVDSAYGVLTERYSKNGKSIPMRFADLLNEVGDELGIENEEELSKIASRFYTDLTLDGRFVIKENNTWVLREHEKYADVHIDMNAIYIEGEDEEEESDEEKKLDDETSLDEVDDEAEKELGEEGDDSFAETDEEYEENN